MNIRPSSLPMLAQCPQFAGEQSEYTDAGTDRHKAFAAGINGDLSLLDFIDEDEQSNVKWAIDYVNVHAPSDMYDLKTEAKVSYKTKTLSFEGTPDVQCGKHIFDLKWRRRDYLAQMAAYALAIIYHTENSDLAVIHILFAESKYAEVHELTHAQAFEIVHAIIAKVASKPEPVPCDYCGWCSKRLTCDALTKHVAKVARGYAEEGKLVESWHPSEMKTADQIGYGLYVWRTILKPWGASMEYHAITAAKKDGMIITGFELKEKQGKQFVSDAKQAFSLLDALSNEEFLTACDVRLNTSKKYPDKVGVIDLVKEKTKTPSRAAAKKLVLAKLNPVLARADSSISLKAIKVAGDDEETNEE